MFTNPVALFDNVRPPILGLDTHDGGTGPISGLPYLNVDHSVKKRVVVCGTGNLEFTGVFMNVMNHNDFASLQSSSSFGVTKTQANGPRQIQMGYVSIIRLGWLSRQVRVCNGVEGMVSRRRFCVLQEC